MVCEIFNFCSITGNCKIEQGVDICRELYQGKYIVESPVMWSGDGNICQSFKINNPNSVPTERVHCSDTK